MNSTLYDYPYFCGANVTLSLNSQWLEDCVGVTYSVMNSQTPVYGYSSSLFDAVAPGQKLVQGSFVINFKHSNYLFNVIESGREIERAEGAKLVMFRKKLADISARNNNEPTEADYKELAKIIGTATESSLKAAGINNLEKKARQHLKRKYWGIKSQKDLVTSNRPVISKDPTLQGPFDIKISFDGVGDYAMSTMTTIYSAYIIGHGKAIQIDENVILEEYNFFARDIVNS